MGHEFRERLLVQNNFAILAPTFRRDRALETGGLDASLPFTADWDLWLRMGEEGPVAQCGEPLGEFRIHGAAQTAAFPPGGMRSDYTRVFERHRVGRGGRPGASGPAVATGRYSIEVNVALADWFHGGRPPLLPLISGGLRLGPLGWWRYLRDSRIVDRAAARVRAGLNRRQA
jgi:hypothetical protein